MTLVMFSLKNRRVKEEKPACACEKTVPAFTFVNFGLQNDFTLFVFVPFSLRSII